MNEILPMILAPACAGLVSWRVICVVNDLSFKTRGQPYPWWLAFGLSYTVFMIAALGSMIHVLQGNGTTVDWLWLFASAGIVVFDRRRVRSRLLA